MKIDDILNIKEKSDFIFANSGIISYKLNDHGSYEDILNHLQVFLLCDLSLEQLSEICFFLSDKKNIRQFNDNNYSNFIRIIFTVCEFVNQSNYSEEGKISLRNKLREYTKYHDYTEEDMKKNEKYVKFKI